MSTSDLTEKIEKLVRDHLAQVRAATAAAVERAFASTTAPKKAPARVPTKRAAGKRRDPAVVAELAERLHAAVMAEPGESMVVYSKQLGAGVRELHRPMTLLKREGRLRATGARNNTRYFPTLGS